MQRNFLLHTTNGSMASGASAPSAQICPNCNGSGVSCAHVNDRAPNAACSACGGSGKLHTA